MALNIFSSNYNNKVIKDGSGQKNITGMIFISKSILDFTRFWALKN